MRKKNIAQRRRPSRFDPEKRWLVLSQAGEAVLIGLSNA